MSNLEQTIATVLTPGRGLLVADEYAEALVDTRALGPGAPMSLVDLVLTTPGLGDQVSAVLLTRRGLQGSRQIRTALRLGAPTGLQVGVRMDPAADLDEVGPDLAALAADGASFVEWRANLPAVTVPKGSAHIDAAALAKGARASQAEGLVPLVTVAMPDLGGNSIGVTEAVTGNALGALFAALEAEGADPARLLLRINMVVAGATHPAQPAPAAVAEATMRVVDRFVPAAVPGVLFLSSGQPLGTACANLAAIAALARDGRRTTRFSFAFTRALVADALRGWDGQADSPTAQSRVAQACRAAASALQPLVTV